MRTFLVLGSILLALVASLVVYVEFVSSPEPRFTTTLEQVVPRRVAGWQVDDVPLADSAAMKQHILSVLNYDQVVQRLYTKQGTQVMVYVAYWQPGKISLSDAGSHNPDSCWVASGCQRTNRTYANPALVGDRRLRPYEWGEYAPPSGGKIQAMFWHLVNGEPNRYEEQEVGWRHGLEGRVERARLVMKDVRERGLNQKAEQMFVRLSSNRRPEELLRDPDFARLLNDLSRLGIFADESWR